MPDVAIIVPTRGRPASVSRLVQACRDTCALDWHLFFGLDDDDPQLRTNIDAMAGIESTALVGTRRGLAEWTNVLWSVNGRNYEFAVSLGDDHVPLTHGWDRLLAEAIETTGGGFAYADNGQEAANLPEMCMISRNVIYALGWMCHPNLAHYYVDNVWQVLGEAAGCLHYRDDVLIRHDHWSFGLSRVDSTYADVYSRGSGADKRAFDAWLGSQMSADAAKVRKACHVAASSR